MTVIHVLQSIIILVILAVDVLLVTFLAVLLHDAARWISSGGFTDWFRTPPGSIQEENASTLAFLARTWRRTRRILRI